MYVRVRYLGKPEAVISVKSKLTKIEEFRRLVAEKFHVEKKLQRLFYGGKLVQILVKNFKTGKEEINCLDADLLEDGFSFHDYGVKLNDVIQLMAQQNVNEAENSKENTKPAEPNIIQEDVETAQSKQEYTDAVSKLYAVGDLVDMKGRVCGGWYEGVIERIVDNTATNSSPETEDTEMKEKTDQLNCDTDTNLLYLVKLDNGEESPPAKLHEIRPRARTVLGVNDLTIGKKVMVNYNCENPDETGLWYDFEITDTKKGRGSKMKLVGTLFLNEGAQIMDTVISLHDKVYAIEEVVPISQRTEEYQNKIKEIPEKRTEALNCTECRDNEDLDCSKCGCSVCRKKEDPDKIILCDECNNGFHFTCLESPLSALPDGDWYCPACKRDPNEVVAPGAASQHRKELTSRKDWGRGMACVGKTKTCPMPEDHFGPIPGVEVGMCWRFRMQLCETGVHRPPVSGIHGREKVGAFSIVLSGGYEDDLDKGEEVIYTGSGGRDLSGNKRVAEHSCDQRLTRENKALARNCAVERVTEAGGDAGDSWREGKPVRLVRSHKMRKHFPKYAPKLGSRYDGIYKVVKFYPETGQSGYKVWKYLLRRDDPAPAPWEEGAPQYDLVYPEGYLEAEAYRKALKKAAKGKKRKSSKRSKSITSPTNGDTSTNDDEASNTLDESTKETPKKKSNKTDNKQVLNQSTINVMFNKRTTRQASKNKKSAEKTDTENLEAEADRKSSTKGAKRKKRKISEQRETSASPSNGDTSTNDDAEPKNLDESATQPPKKKLKKTDQKQVLNQTTINELFNKSTSRGDAKNKKSSAENMDTEATEKSEVASQNGPEPADTPINLTQGSDEDFTKPCTSRAVIDIVTSENEVTSTTPDSLLKKEKPQSCFVNDTQREAIAADELNVKLWEQCFEDHGTRGMKEFVDGVAEVFLCIICQDVVASPVTTPCYHNFCTSCLKRAFSAAGRLCPVCRSNLAAFTPATNEMLQKALRLVMPGYDIGRK